MVESSSQKKQKIVNWSEPSARLFFTEYEDCATKFEQCGWLVFCQKLHGYDANVTLAFAQRFDGKTMKIGDITILKSQRTP